MTQYFDGITTIDALRKEYRRLARANHPDQGGDEATMRAINQAYEDAVNWIKQHGEGAERAKAAADVPADYVRIINAVIACPGLVVEIVGSWVWCTGNTYAHRATLKAAGYRYAARKQAWYWHSPDISIHPPLAGWDLYHISHICQERHFNPPLAGVGIMEMQPRQACISIPLAGWD